MAKDKTPVWAVGPHGRTLTMPMWVWDRKVTKNGRKLGRKYEYGWREATEEEADAVRNETVLAHKALKAKDVVKTLIVNNEAGDKPSFSYTELKKMAKEKGLKIWGVKKEKLEEQLGLV